MSIHIIIDGYNLIRQSKSLRILDRQELQLGRDALLDMLARYKRIKGHRITVVFDGINAPLFTQQRDQVKGIKIKFSREEESADTVIKRMIVGQKEKALVVSSDRDVVKFAASKGAATISAPLFEEKIAMTAFFETKGIEREDDAGWIPTTRKKGPSRRLSKKERRNRAKIKKL
jgi:predicted RNA-binding protein with PIN domain